MKRLLLTVAWAVVMGCVAAAAEAPTTIDLWPGQPPGDKGDLGQEKVLENKPGESQVKRITNVSHPTLTVFRPAKDKDTGVAVVIAPGGGYNILAWDLEGEEVAAWLNSVGVTGVVLKYRVPRRPGTPGDAAPPRRRWTPSGPSASCAAKPPNGTSTPSGSVCSVSPPAAT